MNILGIETSCDETSVAVVHDGLDVLGSVIASQADLHAKTGGVVPEVASRQHLEQMNAVIAEGLSAAALTFQDIDAIAVANRPGLLGALLVGVSAAKALAYALRVPLIGVHHIEAHIYANWLVDPSIEFPVVCLVVSGGHTEIFLVRGHGDYQILGRTRDDAAGEAFDKSARILGIPYPGGVLIDRMARDLHGNTRAVALPRARLGADSLELLLQRPQNRRRERPRRPRERRRCAPGLGGVGTGSHRGCAGVQDHPARRATTAPAASCSPAASAAKLPSERAHASRLRRRRPPNDRAAARLLHRQRGDDRLRRVLSFAGGTIRHARIGHALFGAAGVGRPLAPLGVKPYVRYAFDNIRTCASYLLS